MGGKARVALHGTHPRLCRTFIPQHPISRGGGSGKCLHTMCRTELHAATKGQCLRKSEANRRNALRSTGPRTSGGKAAKQRKCPQTRVFRSRPLYLFCGSKRESAGISRPCSAIARG